MCKTLACLPLFKPLSIITSILFCYVISDDFGSTVSKSLSLKSEIIFLSTLASNSYSLKTAVI